MEVLEKIDIKDEMLMELDCCTSDDGLLTEEEFRKCIEEAERNGEISHAKAERFLMVYKEKA
jgi:hypothetical protein